MSVQSAKLTFDSYCNELSRGLSSKSTSDEKANFIASFFKEHFSSLSGPHTFQVVETTKKLLREHGVHNPKALEEHLNAMTQEVNRLALESFSLVESKENEPLVLQWTVKEALALKSDTHSKTQSRVNELTAEFSEIFSRYPLDLGTEGFFKDQDSQALFAHFLKIPIRRNAPLEEFLKQVFVLLQLAEDLKLPSIKKICQEALFIRLRNQELKDLIPLAKKSYSKAHNQVIIDALGNRLLIYQYQFGDISEFYPFDDAGKEAHALYESSKEMKIFRSAAAFDIAIAYVKKGPALEFLLNARERKPVSTLKDLQAQVYEDYAAILHAFVMANLNFCEVQNLMNPIKEAVPFFTQIYSLWSSWEQFHLSRYHKRNEALSTFSDQLAKYGFYQLSLQMVLQIQDESKRIQAAKRVVSHLLWRKNDQHFAFESVRQLKTKEERAQILEWMKEDSKKLFSKEEEAEVLQRIKKSEAQDIDWIEVD